MRKQIAYITDIHLDEQFIADNGIDSRKNWNILLEDVASRNIRDVVFGGDIGEYSSNEWFFDSLKDFDLNISLGNHDRFSEVTKYFDSGQEQGSNELYYSFEDEQHKHIFLDSSFHAISSEQARWLQLQLESDKKILLFLHHPVLRIQTVLENYWPLKDRDEIRSLLKASNRDVTIFCGHYHTIDEQTEGNILQIVTPAASYQTRKRPGTKDIQGFSRAYSTPDGGTTWNPMSKTEDEIEPSETILMLNNTTFGYRVITLENAGISSELVLFQKGH